MIWPPVKAWTSTSLQKGFRHFVAINYGGKEAERWVSLVAVLDGKCCFVVPWSDLKDPKQWSSGWLQLSRDEANPKQRGYECAQEINKQQSCLHASEDSGLLIPSKVSKIRQWF